MPLFLLSPAFWLAVLLGGAAAFGGGVYVGVRWEKTDNAQSIIVAQNAAIDGANKGTEAATKLALEQASKDASHRLANQSARMAGELDAVKKSRPACARDSESMGLLNNAIDAANDQKAATGKMPDAVRPDPKTGGRVGAILEKLGIPTR